jgi:hypothetical protein
MDFTAHWGWPQWTLAIMLLLSFIYASARHGEERLETSGERKGKPERYSGFVALTRTVIWVGILICGGFFR